MAHAREITRDSRRYWPKKLVTPLQEQVHRITKQRTQIQHNANHVWARRIVAVLASWSIGTIKVFGPPDGSVAGLEPLFVLICQP